MPRHLALVLAVVCACGARTDLGGLRDASTTTDAPDFVWFKLDETSGTTAHDSSSHHYDVTIDGVTWDSGAIFDGATCGKVDVGPAFRDPPITITVWLTPTARADESINDYVLTPFPPNAVSGDTPGAGGYGIGVDAWTDGAPGQTVSIEDGNGASVGFHSIAANVVAGVESFVALVAANASAATVYLDGVVLATTTANDPPTASPPRIHLGCHNDDTGYGSKRFFRGRMRDVRIYQRALAPSDIATLHAAGPV